LDLTFEAGDLSLLLGDSVAGTFQTSQPASESMPSGFQANLESLSPTRIGCQGWRR